MTPPRILCAGLGKRYRIAASAAVPHRDTLGEALSRLLRGGGPVRDFWALRDLDLEVAEGSVLGIVGRNGAGKSTLLKILARITPPTEGTARLRGRPAALLEVGTGFNMELTGRENIALSGAILGMSRADIARSFDAIVDYAGIAEFLDTPVKRYSSGMYLRLGFAVAAHLDPDILLVDEVLAVGDAGFRAKCLKTMEDVGRSGRTVLFVSHDLHAVERVCTEALLLGGGRALARGPVDTVLREYRTLLSENYFASDEARSRPRSGPLHLVNGDLQDASGQSRSRFVFGEDLHVVLDLDVSEAVIAGVELVVRDRRDTPVIFLPSGLRFGVDVAFAPPRGRVRCQLPRLPLAEGEYSLDVQLVRSGRRHTYDRVERALSFSITESDPGGTGFSFTQHSRQGCIHLDARFEADDEGTRLVPCEAVEGWESP